MKYTFLIVLTFFIPILSSGGELTEEQQNALTRTKSFMKNSHQRQEYLKSSPYAQEAHNKAANLLGSKQNVNKAYDMAGQMLESLLKQSNGDMSKVKEALLRGQANPAQLAESMPPEFKKMLRELANDVEGKAGPKK